MATLDVSLPTPIQYGNWTIRSREYAVARVISESGLDGYAYALTRGGPVAEIINKTIAPHYVGTPCDGPETTFISTLASNYPTLGSGVGLRALSIVDLAAWDVAAKTANLPIASLLGGSAQSHPAIGIVGYPPTLGPGETAEQASQLYRLGFRHLKLPTAPTADLTRQRLEAAAAAGDDIVISLDGAWTYHDVESVLELIRPLRTVRFGWLEDMFPPGHTHNLAELRRTAGVTVAAGDEQGELNFPEALIRADAVDVIRLDATCMGGITRLREIAPYVRRSGLRVSPHIFGLVHAQIFSGLGMHDVPIEWSIPGTGVDPYGESLQQPVCVDGSIDPFPPESGFGDLVNAEWLSRQQVDDRAGVFSDLRAPSP